MTTVLIIEDLSENDRAKLIACIPDGSRFSVTKKQCGLRDVNIMQGYEIKHMKNALGAVDALQRCFDERR